MKLLGVVGARPNFMKIAPLARALARRGRALTLLHTGQHYDDGMSRVFFEDLGLPEPDLHLGVGSGSHAEQTGRIMIEFERVCLARAPDRVVVVGDVNSTLACSLVAAKLNIPVAHVEAGLRSFDRAMPEEINRVVTDRLSDLLFTPSPDADRNLEREGVPAAWIHRVGNVMIDSLVEALPRAGRSDVLDRLGLAPRGFAVVTLHRPSNVDAPRTLLAIMGALHELSAQLPVVFSCHPRTAQRLDGLAGYAELSRRGDLRRLAPLGYLDFLRLVSASRLVLTDSGGLQEETTWLRVPCVTLRENTERPITVSEGTNRLAGADPGRILAAAREALAEREPRGRIPELWDGRAAERMADVLAAAG